MILYLDKQKTLVVNTHAVAHVSLRRDGELRVAFTGMMEEAVVKRDDVSPAFYEYFLNDAE